MIKMTRAKLIFIAIFTFMILAVVYFYMIGTRGTDMYSYNNRNRHISASEARAKMNANPGAVILDVRTANEFATGRIKGAKSLPDYAVYDRVRTLIPNYGTMILIYCRSGARSRNVLYTLLEMGYTNVYDFGGIINWPYDIE